jgi:DinB superfamily
MSLYDGWDPPRPGWVCSACAFDYDATPPASTAELLDALLPEYRIRLLSDAEVLRTRPKPTTWSALEYACHVRDCLALYDWRIRRVLSENRPELPQMRRDDVVVERSYNEQDAATVARDMDANCATLAELLQQVSGGDWQRVGVREGEELSVAWMAVNTLHEARHHLMDVDMVLAHVRGGVGGIT